MIDVVLTALDAMVDLGLHLGTLIKCIIKASMCLCFMVIKGFFDSVCASLLTFSPFF